MEAVGDDDGEVAATGGAELDVGGKGTGSVTDDGSDVGGLVGAVVVAVGGWELGCGHAVRTHANWNWYLSPAASAICRPHPGTSASPGAATPSSR
jgi:hypothetical protein